MLLIFRTKCVALLQMSMNTYIDREKCRGKNFYGDCSAQIQYFLAMRQTHNAHRVATIATVRPHAITVRK